MAPSASRSSASRSPTRSTTRSVVPSQYGATLVTIAASSRTPTTRACSPSGAASTSSPVPVSWTNRSPPGSETSSPSTTAT